MIKGMPRPVQYAAIALVWVVAYADWLEPGWLTFGIPSAWDQPLTVTETYDLGCEVKRSTFDAVTPDWAEKMMFWRKDRDDACA